MMFFFCIKNFYIYSARIYLHYIDRTNIRNSLLVLEAAAKFMKDNNKPLLIFPEGTRSNDPNNLNEFKPGLFRYAKSNFVPIVPVTINRSKKAEKSLFSLFKRVEVEIIFHDHIKPQTFINLETNIIAKKVQRAVESKLNKNQ